jgi:WD40 repeat protein
VPKTDIAGCGHSADDDGKGTKPTGRVMWIQKIPGGGVDGLAYSPDGRTLYVADRGGAVTAWDTAARTRRPLIPAAGYVRRLAPLAGGKHLLIGGYPHVLVWDVAAGAEVGRSAPAAPFDALPVPGGDRVLSRPSDRLSLVAWKPAAPADGVTFAGPFPSPVRAFDLSPDARTVAFAPDYSRTCALFDVAAGRVTAASAEFDSGLVWGVRFAPDGRTLAVFSGRQVRLGDAHTLALRDWRLTVHNRFGEAAFAFHPHAPAFVAIGLDGSLALYGAETGEPLRALDFALGRFVRCVAFAPDGLTCAVGGSNKQFAVFDVDI